MIWSLCLGKAPGLDGLLICFYKRYRSIIKKDLCKMLNCSKWRDKLVGAMNSYSISLIPKEKNPTTFKRFKPISLCYALGKILTKFIDNSLKWLVPKIIYENQGDFLASRQILDNIIIV